MSSGSAESASIARVLAALLCAVALVAIFLVLTAAGLAFGEVVAAFWSADYISGNWRTAANLSLAALAAGTISLLLESERLEDGVEIHVIRIVAVLAVGLLTILALVEISDSGPDVSVRLMAVVAIFYVLCSALVPLLQWGTQESWPEQGEDRS